MYSPCRSNVENRKIAVFSKLTKIKKGRRKGQLAKMMMIIVVKMLLATYRRDGETKRGQIKKRNLK